MTIPPEASPSVPPVPFPRPLTARRSLFILVMYLLTQVAAILAVMIVMGLATTSDLGDIDDLTSQMSGYGVIPGTIAALFLGGIVVVRLARRSFPETSGPAWLDSIGWVPTSWRNVVAGAGLGVLLALVYLVVVGSFFPPSENQEPGPLVTAAMSSGWAKAGWAVAALILAPPVEEFLFRGVVLTGFSRSWGPRVASVLMISIFTALHYSEASGYLPGLVAIAILATVLTFARFATGSLLPGMAIHMGYNFSMVVLLYTLEG